MRTRFGELLDRVQTEPFRVKPQDRTVGVMVSAEDFEAMRVFYADRLGQTLNNTGIEAILDGMNPETLANHLADES